MDEELSVGDARLLLLHAQELLGNPESRATPAKVLRLIEALGFVQLDSIPVVERAQHLILRTRLENYRPASLKHLVEKRRSLFEHWTHDASVIPVDWLPHWRHRSKRFLELPGIKRWVDHRLGDQPNKVLRETRQRIDREGPLRSRDFEPPTKGRDSGWWRWKPHKAALEYLWWSGELCISARDRFEKVYDFTHRAHPEHHALPTPSLRETIDQVCHESIARLGVATATEIAAFYALVSLPEARAWCKRELAAGNLITVEIRTGAEKPRAPGPVYARPDLKTRIRKARQACARQDDRLRLLAPFDPVIRDRKRALRLFNFDYRFEAYTPPAKRRYGYYVLPILQRDRIIGRCDLKMHRDRNVLELKGAWWEQGIRPTKALNAQFEEALEKLAEFTGATHGVRTGSR